MLACNLKPSDNANFNREPKFKTYFTVVALAIIVALLAVVAIDPELLPW